MGGGGWVGEDGWGMGGGGWVGDGWGRASLREWAASAACGLARGPSVRAWGFVLTAYSRATCKPTPPSALVCVRISSATLVMLASGCLSICVHLLSRAPSSTHGSAIFFFVFLLVLSIRALVLLTVRMSGYPPPPPPAPGPV